MHSLNAFTPMSSSLVRIGEAVAAVEVSLGIERLDAFDTHMLAPLLQEPAELTLPFDGVTMLAAAAGLSTLRAIVTHDRQTA